MRRIFLFASVWVAVMPALAQPRALGHTVRWDLVQIVQGTALSGGMDVGIDAATGDTFTLTGSGATKPAEADAAGGGIIVHHFAATNTDSTAVYVVTGFISWQPGEANCWSQTVSATLLRPAPGFSPIRSTAT